MENRDWQSLFPNYRERKASRPHRAGRTGGNFIWVVGAVLILLILLGFGRGIYTEWLWFSSLGYSSVFTTIIGTRAAVFFIAAAVVCALLLGNLILAKQLVPKVASDSLPVSVLSRFQRVFKGLIIGGTSVMALIFGLVAQGNWSLFLRFFNAQQFGMADPVFHKEIGFYVFTLPFMQFIHGWLLAALIITLLAAVGVYLLGHTLQNLRIKPTKSILAHLCTLLLAVLALFAWGYWLGIWELVFSSEGVVFGAGYADMHARLPAQWILLGVVVLVMILVVLAVIRGRFRWPLYGIGIWIVAAIVVGAIFPALLQRLQVQPNELELERPYIGYSIDFTREAFALNRVEEQSFPAEDAPTVQDVADNDLTINNIRLWDTRPLKDTYNQIQSIRLYYDFNDVDVDRYVIDGQYRQVMISARELSVEKLDVQAQTWVNRHLQFTHGYGLAMSPVNEITLEGLPVLWMKDIPPTGVFKIQRPEIYFGEKTNHHVIVNTKADEFDYPMGEGNVYGRWQGQRGVDVGGFINRLAYAWEFGDLNILISSEITAESKLLYRRNIAQRVQQLVPFLQLDNDPYLVVMDGRLMWIQDAYTTTDRYPYSEPYRGGMNYIRNSVKAVIDAYDGSTTFYVSDPTDPLMQTYASIFPDIFVPLESMPPSLREHLRYPLDMFQIQAEVFQSYHMRDVRVFYNKEDLWAIPREVYAEREQAVEPYYVIMRLPGEDKEEFLLMLPFTPVNKNNAIGWLAARSDAQYYGTLLAYLFPKERLVYGPSQIENRIQQDTVITEQLALWSRGGSRVIRGNLLLVPLAQSKLYVEPVFLQSESGGLPELKRVIVAIGDRIVMEPTLKQSLEAIMGAQPPVAQPPVLPIVPPAIPPAETPGEAVGDEISTLIAQAQRHYDRAQEYLKEGDWAGYGRELDLLKGVLDRLSGYANEQ